jgi:hypothetical protein
MTTQVTAPDHQQETTGIGTQVAMTALTLVILAAVGAWWATGDTTAPQPTAARDAMPAGDMGAATATAAPALPASPRLTIYLVGSEDERAFFQAALDLAGAARMPDVPMTSFVVNVAVPGGEGVAQAIANDANLVRADGQPALTLIDLRTR